MKFLVSVFITLSYCYHVIGTSNFTDTSITTTIPSTLENLTSNTTIESTSENNRRHFHFTIEHDHDENHHEDESPIEILKQNVSVPLETTTLTIIVEDEEPDEPVTITPTFFVTSKKKYQRPKKYPDRLKTNLTGFDQTLSSSAPNEVKSQLSKPPVATSYVYFGHVPTIKPIKDKKEFKINVSEVVTKPVEMPQYVTPVTFTKWSPQLDISSISKVRTYSWRTDPFINVTKPVKNIWEGSNLDMNKPLFPVMKNHFWFQNPQIKNEIPKTKFIWDLPKKTNIFTGKAREKMRSPKKEFSSTTLSPFPKTTPNFIVPPKKFEMFDLKFTERPKLLDNQKPKEVMHKGIVDHVPISQIDDVITNTVEKTLESNLVTQKTQTHDLEWINDFSMSKNGWKPLIPTHHSTVETLSTVASVNTSWEKPQDVYQSELVTAADGKTKIKLITKIEHVPVPYTVYKRVPYTVEKPVPYTVKVPVPKPYTVYRKVPYPVKHYIKIPYYVPQPYTVYRKIPYEVKVPVPRAYKVEMSVPKPYTVLKKVPYAVHVTVPQPYTVETKIGYPVEVKIPVPQPVYYEKRVPYEIKIPIDRPVEMHVPKPYPVYVEKHIPVTVLKRVPVEVKIPVHKPFPVVYHKPVPYEVKVPVPEAFEFDTTVPVGNTSLPQPVLAELKDFKPSPQAGYAVTEEDNEIPVDDKLQSKPATNDFAVKPTNVTLTDTQVTEIT